MKRKYDEDFHGDKISTKDLVVEMYMTAGILLFCVGIFMKIVFF